MIKSTFILISLIFIGVSAQNIHAQMEPIPFESVKKGIAPDSLAQLKLLDVSIQVWPERNTPKGKMHYTFELLLQSPAAMYSKGIPYTELLIYDSKGNYLGASEKTFGSFYSRSGTEKLSVVLKKNISVNDLQIFLASGFSSLYFKVMH
ncbi:MAG: hypothetical protein AB8B56_18035 [Crocinitomicaceae bacterium]